MSLSISSAIPIAPIAPNAGVGAASAAGKSANFASLMDRLIQGVEQPRQEANQAVQNQFPVGIEPIRHPRKGPTQAGRILPKGDGELHTVALATQRADLVF